MRDAEFDFGEGKRRGDEGMSKARGNQSNFEFNHRASLYFFRLEIGDTFTPDDVTRNAGLPGDGTANTGGAVGAWINGMMKAGFIKWTGAMAPSERPERHGSQNKVWRKIRG